MNKYPDLRNSKVISFDIETYDPELIEKGTGVFRRDGYILGVSIANDKGFADYYNLGHKDVTPELKQKNLRYIEQQLGYDVSKLGTNTLYDIDWLENWQKIKVNGKQHDIRTAEALIDENRKTLGIDRPYSLDSLGEKYLKRGKFKTDIDRFCENNNLPGDPRKWLWKMDSTLVGPYAIEDVKLPLEIFKYQWEILTRENLTDIYEIEMGLYPLLTQMRKNGVRVNRKGVYEALSKLKYELEFLEAKVYMKHGRFNYNSSKQIAKLFDAYGIPYPLTEKGNPSLKKEVLEKLGKQGVKLAEQIVNMRKCHKISNTFLINAIHNHIVLDRIHCDFYPTSTDKYGTKSGRFSSANPNLQQEPSDDVYGPICRSIFIPEENCDWIKLDYSQIEYRFIAHYATGEKSDEIRRLYNTDPDTDYHQTIMNWTGLGRKKAKALNFGTAYFMGVKTCSEQFGWTREESENLLAMYYMNVPFLKTTRNRVVEVGKANGYIRTILNRRARISDQMREYRKEHSLFNRLIQGSAADLLKKAMYDCYKAKIFDVLKLHLTVHDELDVSKPRTKEADEALLEMKNIMENCIKLSVPIKVDIERGPNWGTLTKIEYKNGKWLDKPKEVK